MRRVIALLIVGAAVVAAAWGLANLTGHVSATVGNFRIETSAAIAVLSLAVAFLVGVLALRLLIWLVTLPFGSNSWRRRVRERTGERAITRVLVALASGEDRIARREAKRVRDLLGETPQTLLLAAEAGRLAGREDEAEEAYKALTKRDDGRFLGYRGLLRQAIERRDWQQADTLAREAEAARPGTAWLRQQRAELAVQNNAWAEAAELSDQSTQRATYLIAAADAAKDSNSALAYAKQAWRLDPSFAPAALAYAKQLRATGKEKRALAAIVEAWKNVPHPDLAEAALATATTPEARYEAAKRLVETTRTHPESRLLLARTAIEAGKLADARQEIDAAKAAGLNQRRLWLLVAEIAEAEKGDTEAGQTAQRDAMRQAGIAEADPAWRCTSCRTDAAAWAPRCPACNAAGSLVWQSTTPVLTLSAAG